MIPNDFSTYYKTISNTELLEILEKQENYQPAAIEAAKKEFQYRQLSDEDIHKAKQPLILKQLEKEEQRKKIKTKLKISSKGIWTNKLGFVSWDKINETKVTTENKGEHSSIVLEVYLKNTIYEQANQPDERLVLDEVEDANFIETDIDVLKEKK